jgi:hypothetical protein
LELAAGERVRLPAADLDRPAPLPFLAQAQPDRAPLTDPTGEATLKAALAAPAPERTAPAPFLRLNLPDPFEHRNAVKLRTPPEDEPAPALAVAAPGR